MRIVSIACPHCKGPVRATKSRSMGDLLKEVTYACKDPECGHVFVAGLEVLRTVSLSSKPNPKVRIPISQHVRRTTEDQLLTAPLATA